MTELREEQVNPALLEDELDPVHCSTRRFKRVGLLTARDMVKRVIKRTQDKQTKLMLNLIRDNIEAEVGG